jgi:2-haloacid dehalogenase
MKYTLAFDVYGTLIDTTGVFQSLEKMIGEKAELFMNMWRNKQLEYSFRRGLMNLHVDFSICTKEALDYCCLFFRIKLTANQKKTLMNEYKVLPTFNDVNEGLESLKNEGHQLYAFSNGSAQAVKQLLNNAGIKKYFKGIVSTEQVKMFKPNPIVYRHFNEVTNSKKSKSWLISSNPFDVMGAINYGMNSAWVKRSSKAIFDPWGIEPTETIQSIIELTNKLKNCSNK